MQFVPAGGRATYYTPQVGSSIKVVCYPDATYWGVSKLYDERGSLLNTNSTNKVKVPCL